MPDKAAVANLLEKEIIIHSKHVFMTDQDITLSHVTFMQHRQNKLTIGSRASHNQDLDQSSQCTIAILSVTHAFYVVSSLVGDQTTV